LKDDLTTERIYHFVELDEAAAKLASVVLWVNEASCPLTNRKVKKHVRKAEIL
jgi:polyisoprenoid-binding protein YceI